MILPIYTYGQPVLRERAAEIEADSPGLQRLIDDMLGTMRHASGIGLAAPQVGRSIRLFVADASAVSEGEAAGALPAPLVFINPVVEADDDGPHEEYEEGCLSIPDLRDLVVRPARVRVRFLDRHFAPHDLEAAGMLARVVQHELDHLDGVLFVDHLSPLRRRMLGRRLRGMARGQVDADYPLEPAAG